MVTTLTIDKACRIVLSKPVRDELQLSPGDYLEVDSSEERVILRPVLERADLQEAGSLGFRFWRAA